MASGPLIGVTADLAERDGRVRMECTLAYAEMIEAAGAVPLLLTPVAGSLEAQVAPCDGIVLTGGDDPRTEGYGEPTHPRATPVHPVRQAYEEALLAHLAANEPDLPVLGVCLGMQMMALAAGGRLDQHMPETCDPEGRHWDGDHGIVAVGAGGLGEGVVRSRHRQCVSDPGRLEVVARADDGVIEGVRDPSRAHYVGVQWHPERSGEGPLGLGLFRSLAAAARRSAIGSP